MRLPTSGPLSMSNINGEFGRGTNLNSYRGTDYYNTTGGPYVFPAFPISFNNFYGTQATNPLGFNWQNSTPLSSLGSWGSSSPRSIAWNGSVFCASANSTLNDLVSGRCATSPDGITWTYQTGIFTALGTDRSPVFLGGRPGQFVAFAGATLNTSYPLRIAISSDGVTWQAFPVPATWGSNDSAQTWAYGGGVWIGAGVGASNPTLRSSDGGYTWTRENNLIGAGVAVNEIAWSGTAFLLVGATTGGAVTRASSSTDGITYTSRQTAATTAMSSRGARGVAWNGSVFCVVGDYNTCATVSADGSTWTTQIGLQAIFGNVVSPSINAIVWASNSGLFIATGENNLCAVSADGITWTQSTGLALCGYTSGSGERVSNPMAYNGSKIVCVSRGLSAANVAYTPV